MPEPGAGEVEGIGGARLINTAIKQRGQLEGRMEFDLQSLVSQFGDMADAGPNKTNHGMLSGSDLRIESALGGTYDLTLQGNLPTGTYVRGTKAAFRKSRSWTSRPYSPASSLAWPYPWAPNWRDDLS